MISRYLTSRDTLSQNWCIRECACVQSALHPLFTYSHTSHPYRVFSSVSASVVSDSLRPHGLQHARPRCPSPTPGTCSNSYPSSQWCHPAISSSVVLFSSCLQSFPASESFPMSQFFTSGGQSIGTSASALVLPGNIQDYFPLGWTGWISLQSKGLSRVFYNITVQKHSSVLGFVYGPTLTYMDLCQQSNLSAFNMLSRFVIAFLPRSKHHLITWLQSPSAVILEPKKIKSRTVTIVPHPFAMKWWDWMP